MRSKQRNQIIHSHLTAMVTQTDISGSICICIRPGGELVDVVGLCDQRDAAATEVLSNLSKTLQALLGGNVIRPDGTLNLTSATQAVLAEVDEDNEDEETPTLLH